MAERVLTSEERMAKSGFLEISLESSWIGRRSCLGTEMLDGEL